MSHQQVMSPTSELSLPHPSMLRRRRTMEHDDDGRLALMPPAEEPRSDELVARAEALEGDGKKEEDEKKEFSTPARSTTGVGNTGTGKTEMEVFKSGGSKESVVELKLQKESLPLWPLGTTSTASHAAPAHSGTDQRS